MSSSLQSNEVKDTEGLSTGCISQNNKSVLVKGCQVKQTSASLPKCDEQVIVARCEINKKQQSVLPRLSETFMFE